ncbi:MAG: hypothetical protein HYW48_10805 [Deltaproteobacteria bacterium]|nr:hypothetical protein [Deltaproteobacteria bacterium]
MNRHRRKFIGFLTIPLPKAGNFIVYPVSKLKEPQLSTCDALRRRRKNSRPWLLVSFFAEMNDNMKGSFLLIIEEK